MGEVAAILGVGSRPLEGEEGLEENNVGEEEMFLVEERTETAETKETYE